MDPHIDDRSPSPSTGPWKHGTIPVLGLIGGIGAGKSLVAALLAGRGAAVIDADAVGHDVLKERAVRDQVVARFGEGIVARPGAAGEGSEISSETPEPPPIDRRAVGAIVFADPAALRDLEALVHPPMCRAFERAIDRAVREARAPAVVLDAAVLLEKGWDALCDHVVYVDAPRAQRLARLAAQRGWTEAMLTAREEAQWPAEEKKRRADLIVVNDGGPDALEAAVDGLWSTLVMSPALPGHPPRAAQARTRGPGPAARGQPSPAPSEASKRS
ncbi:MAG: dephospho-CoA kinase [Planctomycetaceae bacterium]|nr:dephospho-CoA kinase [Planctomycetaceae bacterium]